MDDLNSEYEYLKKIELEYKQKLDEIENKKQELLIKINNEKSFYQRELDKIKIEFANQQDSFEKFTQQYIENGFHDGDTFDLSDHLSELILPRLKRYKELAGNVIAIDFPLDEIIEAFELYSCKYKFDPTEKDFRKMSDGFRLFGEHFERLWW